MTKHRALEDTIGRAQHYGAIARDALALVPDLGDEARRWRRRSTSASRARINHNSLKLTYFRSFPRKREASATRQA